ncbi:MAG TPA: TetR/AcrR family transcriptional regulator [Steroidobacteraceae bacterium]|jgi:TetR/AcrR family transcriptional repressor of lmrAB and yxaGH operons|nr:TetR/AcrR family transcriptional regulator [Steroidobacteraceae bacterium]
MTNSRQRAIETAERLFRSQGYAATGLTQILHESGSPKGSFYFHFPNGKHELALATLESYGQRVDGNIRAIALEHARDPIGFVRSLARFVAREMESSGWSLGCLNHKLASELVPGDPAITEVTANVYRGWVTQVAYALSGIDGATRKDAERLAMSLLAGLAGARGLARIYRSPEPFEAVAQGMIDAMRSFAVGHPRSAASVRRRKAHSR